MAELDRLYIALFLKREKYLASPENQSLTPRFLFVVFNNVAVSSGGVISELEIT
jgi:hypothetical protein